ncbi:MAG: tRNA epoxyqueuosine(34) reductase QueG [Magnetococcales bacterium]|nr:tRNA epoxyqueuosine(34) reductase QueG [Magnetococcales bacterium]
MNEPVRMGVDDSRRKPVGSEHHGMDNGNNPWLKLKESLRARAHALGFDAVGFAAPHPPPGSHHFPSWIESGRHGSMEWLANHVERRLDPGRLLPGAGVVMTLGMNYRPREATDDHDPAPHRPRMAAFCRIDDYHVVVKQRLKELARWLEREWGAPLEGRVFVDTAPIMEKPLAMASGLGWQGKNTLLVSRKWGCWLFLGAYVLPLPLPPDPPATSHCGRCRRCCIVCPTGALEGNGGMDARRCIAYLTIESRDPIPRDCRTAMGNRLVGCDDCLRICPWNRFAPPTREPRFNPRTTLAKRSLLAYVTLDDTAFRRRFHKTGIQRVGRTRFLRNLAITLGNWGTAAAAEGLKRLLHETEPLIRGAAVWGLGQVAVNSRENGQKIFPILREMAQREQNLQVREEIDQTLSPCTKSYQ